MVPEGKPGSASGSDPHGHRFALEPVQGALSAISEQLHRPKDNTHTESVKAKLCDPTRNGSECRMYASESITKASGIHCQAAEHQGVRAPVRGALGRLHHTRPKSGHLARLSIK